MPANSSPSAPIKGLPPLPKMGGRYSRPKPLRKVPTRPMGPRIYRLGQKPRRADGGPGEPPIGFVTPHTSKTEWVVYWAMAKVLGTPLNPRKPPFTGGSNWQYQKSVGGGRRVRGGQVLDFVVFSGVKSIGIRVETERFHIFTNATTHAYDFYLRTHAVGVDEVVAIYDSDFLGDTSGRAACAVVARAVKGEQDPNPIRLGTARRIRA